jgi:membrane protein required for colicin V production
VVDLVALLLLAAFGSLGAWRGALESGFRLIALVAGYAIAAHAAVTAGGPVSDALGVAPWVGAPLAATAAFLASQVLFAIGAVLIRAAERRRLAASVRSAADRVLGAVFGLVRGGAIVLLLGWLLLFVDALRVTGLSEQAPNLSGASLPPLAGRVAEGTARAVLGDDQPGARIVTAMAGRPGETAEALRAMLEHPRLQDLQQDTRFWSDVENGDVDRALARDSMRRLAGDAALRRQLAGLGVIGPDAAAEPARFREALTETLEQLAPRLRSLRRDPETRRLLADPEVQRRLQAVDAQALLGREDFRGLVTRVLEASPGA